MVSNKCVCSLFLLPYCYTVSCVDLIVNIPTKCTKVCNCKVIKSDVQSMNISESPYRGSPCSLLFTAERLIQCIHEVIAAFHFFLHFVLFQFLFQIVLNLKLSSKCGTLYKSSLINCIYHQLTPFKTLKHFKDNQWKQAEKSWEYLC